MDDREIIGFMTCGKPYKPFQDFQQEIGLLYILQEYQRQGIGKSFFDNAIKFYRSMGGQVIHTDEKQIKLVFMV